MDEENSKVLVEEVQMTLKYMKNGKTAGKDN